MPSHPSITRHGVILDIDGVLHAHGRPIDGSAEAVTRLCDELHVPVAFLSNGGGDSEAAKALSLSRLVGRTVLPHQVVLAHTPFRHLAPAYKGRRVLILGGLDSVNVARDVYGFDGAVSAEEFQCEYPELVPFKIFHNEEQRLKAEECKSRRALKSVEEQQEEIRSGLLNVAAIFYFTSMEVDLLNDVQIAVDVLAAAADGEKSADHLVNERATLFYMQADDDLWAASAAVGPRLGESAFRKALEMAYETTTGTRLKHLVQYGKPRKVAFDEARLALEQQARYLLSESSPPHSSSPSSSDAAIPFEAIYMVGDNLHVDILGANAMGAPWKSVHVQTGVQFAADHGSRYHDVSDSAPWFSSDEHLKLHNSIQEAGGCIRADIVVADLKSFVEQLANQFQSS